MALMFIMSVVSILSIINWLHWSFWCKHIWYIFFKSLINENSTSCSICSDELSAKQSGFRKQYEHGSLLILMDVFKHLGYCAFIWLIALLKFSIVALRFAHRIDMKWVVYVIYIYIKREKGGANWSVYFM